MTAGIVVIVLMAVATILWVVSSRETVRESPFAGGTLTVRASSIDLEAVPTALTPEQASAMASLYVAEYVASSPVSITTTGEIPESGVTLELTLDEPVPEGVIATFAYFDEETGMWVPELSMLSEDRRTLRATVDHLSDWNAFFTGIGEGWNSFVTGAGDLLSDVGQGFADTIDRGSQQFYRFTHELLGNAADAPACTGEAPYWLREVSVSRNTGIDLGIGEGAEGINAVLMCSGTDETGTKLVIKAAANRGYGFVVELPDAMTPTPSFTPEGLAWEGAGFASTLDETVSGVFDALYALSVEMDTEQFVLHPRAFVPPTETITYVIDKEQFEESYDEIVANPGSGRIIEVVTPNLFQFFMSLGMRFVTESLGPDEVAGMGPELAVAVWSMWNSCDIEELSERGNEVPSAQLIGDTTWLAECLDSLEPFEIEQNIATMGTFAEDVLESPPMADSIRVRGSQLDMVVKNLKWLAIAAYAQSTVDYIGDVITDVGSGVPAGFAYAVGYPPGSVYWQEVATEGCWYHAEGAPRGCTTVPTSSRDLSWQSNRAFSGPTVIEADACTRLDATVAWGSVTESSVGWYCPAGVAFTIDGQPVAEDTIAGAISVFPENPTFNCTGCGGPYNIVGGGDDPAHDRVYIAEEVGRESGRMTYEVVPGWFQAFWRVP